MTGKGENMTQSYEIQLANWSVYLFFPGGLRWHKSLYPNFVSFLSPFCQGITSDWISFSYPKHTFMKGKRDDEKMKTQRGVKIHNWKRIKLKISAAFFYWHISFQFIFPCAFWVYEFRFSKIFFVWSLSRDSFILELGLGGIKRSTQENEITFWKQGKFCVRVSRRVSLLAKILNVFLDSLMNNQTLNKFQNNNIWWMILSGIVVVSYVNIWFMIIISCDNMNY